MSTAPWTKPWTTPAAIEQQLMAYWTRGQILAARLAPAPPLFPLLLRIKKPDAVALAQQFDDVRRWIKSLEEGSKPARGFGYEIDWAEINHRQLGRNRVPNAVRVPTEDDALRLLGLRAQAARFQALVDATIPTHPPLVAWLTRRPLAALEHAEDWPRVLAVLAWFLDHPRAGLYMRQLDIPGVDTKFIEAHKGLLADLLDLVLPAEAIDRNFVGASQFEPRYGLATKPPLLRFRLLDERLYVGGLADLAVPADAFARLDIHARRVFITENEINGLAFPAASRSLVVFGLGYGIERLGEVAWLRQKAIYYWGDIDTHGFVMLDRLRAALPQTRSFLMDRETLMAHRAQWVREPVPHRGPLGRLSAAELGLFHDLRDDRLGESVRLEQERIGFRALERALHEIG